MLRIIAPFLYAPPLDNVKIPYCNNFLKCEVAPKESNIGICTTLPEDDA